MTLAELLAEGKRLDEAATFADRGSIPWGEFADTNARVDAFYAEHGPRLARVAEAAVEMRRYYLRHDERCRIWSNVAPKCTCGLTALLAAFDADAWGDRLPQPDEQEGKE